MRNCICIVFAIALLTFQPGCDRKREAPPPMPGAVCAPKMPPPSTPPTAPPSKTDAQPSPSLSAYLPPANAPTYSEVLKTYPAGVRLCETVATVEGIGESGWLLNGEVDYREGKPLVRYYGAKITLGVAVEINGKTFQPGAKLTVDKDSNWIEVKSWD